MMTPAPRDSVNFDRILDRLQWLSKELPASPTEMHALCTQTNDQLLPRHNSRSLTPWKTDAKDAALRVALKDQL
jgi:hypothetical protein